MARPAPEVTSTTSPGLDELEAKIARGAFERGQGALGERAADGKLIRVVAKIGAVVADDLGVAGDEAAVRSQHQRVDLQQLQILLPRDVRQPRGIAREPRRKVGRKQLGDRAR